MLTDVSLWFAKNKQDTYTTIFEINDENRYDEYLCPVCLSKVIPKAIKDDALMSSHFAHVDASKCNSESIIHWCYKNNFLIKGSNFSIIDRITSNEVNYTCEEVYIEQRYNCENKIYIPDVTVKTVSGETIFFEMNYKNKKRVEDYLNIWLELNCTVVEIDIKYLLNLNYDGFSFVFNPIFINGKCYAKPSIKKKCYNNIIHIKESAYAKREKSIANIFVNKLDWLWSTITKYKLSDTFDINELYCSLDYLIDNSEEEDIKLIFDIINKFKCTDILCDYGEYRQKAILNKILNVINPNILKWYNIRGSGLNYYSYNDNNIIMHSNNFYFNHIFSIYKYNADQLIIKIQDCINNEFLEYFHEYLSELWTYDFPQLFNNVSINLSYNKFLYNSKYKVLDQYDFVSATERLENLLVKSQDYLNNEINSVVCDINSHPRKKVIHNEDIDKELYNILYPLLYLVNHTTDNNINIVFDAKFTIDKSINKTQKWIINDFINILNKFGYNNFYNVK